MQEILKPAKDVLDLLVQLLVLVIPVVISWFIRTYVRGSTVQWNLAAIGRLSSAAIDYVENLDSRGDIVLPPGINKGGHKLKLATQWLSGELNRAGIDMSDDQAEKWIASEFQKRAGDSRSDDAIAEFSGTAVDLIEHLDGTKLLEPPAGVDRTSYLAGLAADWIITQLAKRGTSISRDEALAWVRAEELQRLEAKIGKLPVDDRLATLAIGAVEFLEKLKAGGQLAIQPGSPGEDIDTDVATAWLLTEAAKAGLVVTSDQIAQAIGTALRQRIPVPA